MKTRYIHILLMTAISLTSCSLNKHDIKEYDDYINIFARIDSESGTRVSNDGSSFSEGDAIKVVNLSRQTSNAAIFRYDEQNDSWNTTEPILWEGVETNSFEAWYPAEASFETFNIPADQSDNPDHADWMTASATAKKADGGVGFSFKRHMSKVKIVIVGWGDEYAENTPEISQMSLLSSSSTLSHNDGIVTGDQSGLFVQTHIQENDKSMIAIVAPGTYHTDTELIRITLNGNQTPLLVKISKALTLISGKVYTFRLTIGKDLLTLDDDSVSVSDWVTENLGDINIEDIY